MHLILKDNLPFVTVTVAFGERQIAISSVLIDTGSAATILSADSVARLGVEPAPDDILHTIRGVGGYETVFTRRATAIQIGNYELLNCDVQIGGMDYGFEINGILGMDILMRAGALLDLKNQEIAFPSPSD